MLNLESNHCALGCTFTPEKYPDQQTLIAGLKFVLDTLKLRQIRFAVRWDKVMKGDGTLSLEYYLPLFDLMAKYDDLKLCLNLGPIKTTDWPEVHVPQFVLQKYSDIPKWPRELNNQHLFTKEAGEYLRQLCQLLTSTLPQIITNSVTTIQLNNEGYNPFGENLIVSSIFTELYFESIASTYFPDRPILFNSAGKLQANKILKTQAKLNSSSILGIDYYYHTPTNDYPLIRNYNQLNLPLPWLPTMNTITKKLQKMNIILEFTEVQMEKWGHITYPGESKEALIATINLLAQYKPKHQATLLLRLWGVELLACSFVNNKQSKGMEELAQFISDFPNK